MEPPAKINIPPEIIYIIIKFSNVRMTCLLVSRGWLYAFRQCCDIDPIIKTIDHFRGYSKCNNITTNTLILRNIAKKIVMYGPGIELTPENIIYEYDNPIVTFNRMVSFDEKFVWICHYNHVLFLKKILMPKKKYTTRLLVKAMDFAAQKGNMDIIELLLKHFSKLHVTRYQLERICCKYENIKIAKLMLPRYEITRYSISRLIKKTNNIEIVELICKQAKDSGVVVATPFAINVKKLKILIEYGLITPTI